MKCLICKNGVTKKAEVIVTSERDNTIIIIKKVPAHVCQNCGEEYVAEKTIDALSRGES